MAMTGVLRPGHAQIRVLDMAEATHFYSQVLGLVETGRDEQGRVYYKAWDEWDHSSVILRQSDRAGLDFIGFKVASAADLDRFEAGLRDYGLATERIPAGEMLETGERLRFESPTGHLFELYADKKFVGNGLPMVDPAPWNADAERGIAPLRMDHCLLCGPDIAKLADILIKVLGFQLTEYVLLPDGQTRVALWLSCSIKSHDIALLEGKEPGKLHHIGYMLESWEKVLRAGDILSMNKVSVDVGPTRHGVTRGRTMYAWDPSGNRFETFHGGIQHYPDMAPIAWTWDGFADGGLDYPQRRLHQTFLTVMT